MKYKLEEILKKHNINNLTFDSKNIKANDAFFAFKGHEFDGNDFIEEAIKSGVKVIITDSDKSFAEYQDKANLLKVDNTRIAFAIASDILYPKLPKYFFAATGTNGKTSVSYYIQQLIEKLDESSCYIGTTGIKSSVPLDNLYKLSKLTTPEANFLRKILHELAENNVNYIALEASSQGLEQERLHGLKFIGVCFTSFSQDHLDYHKNMQDYLEAKLKLFRENLLPDSMVVINSEIEELDQINKILSDKKIKPILIGKDGDLQIINLTQNIQGQKVEFSFQNKNYKFQTEIIGNYQIYNLLMASLLVSKVGFAFSDIIDKLHYIEAAPGRLERISSLNNSFHIFVDNAHSPDSLEKSLIELKKIIEFPGKLIILFGCGGNRDKTKRPIMGEIASRLADIVIITDDNPRNENPEQIRKEILAKAPHAIEIAGRKEAIAESIKKLGKNDILLIAGRGHEKWQIIGDKKIEFNDKKEALKIMEYYDNLE